MLRRGKGKHSMGRTGEPYEAEVSWSTPDRCIVSYRQASGLHRAGVEPEGSRVYELASGEPIELQYGFARISFLGDETVSHVIFGAENAEPLLGVVALENTGVMVDPVTQTLKRLPAMPLKSTRTASRSPALDTIRHQE